ncbi:L-threonylcarbamoyladenylate synthase [Micromonospora gifhornensis]|uniref:L-threonylcarbamoyladenylate synthase n=1 Tax=Micromonospora gifhornensis TaxID=84594 RepID=UPI003D722884
MSGPDHVFRASDLTPGGSLTTRALSLIVTRLNQGGFVLLPSDTCYSIALVPHNEDSWKFINSLLRRPVDRPVSVAFSGLDQVRGYLELNATALHLVERFTPGPITLVCPANQRAHKFAAKSTASPDRTLGFRIPDSKIERDVASHARWPITTTAVRDKRDEPVQSFDEALKIVTAAAAAVGSPRWHAVEGRDSFYSKHSTVVRVDHSGEVGLIREGDIPFETIRQSTHWLPASDLDRW